MKCKICDKEVKRIGPHVFRGHKMTMEDYVLKFEHNNKHPLCKCGCGEKVNWNGPKSSFYDYIKGHQQRDDKIKNKIGKKNSKNMKKYFKDNPDIANIRGEQMRANLTEESRIIGTKSLINFNKSKRGRQMASERSSKAWAEDREKMMAAVEKATQTRMERIETGEITSYDKAWRDKISQSITEKYIGGGFQWSRGHYTSSISGKTYWYRSSWELEYMKYLDENPNVEFWDYEPFSIEYEFEETTRRYIPDFQVHFTDGRKIIAEIKPGTLTGTQRNQEKIIAGEEWCKQNGYNFYIISNMS